MKKYLITLFAVVAVCMSAQAQGEDWGLGLRFGSPSGITLKRYMGNNAWDLTVGTSGAFGNRNWGRRAGLDIMFTYHWRRDFGDVNNLTWYYGVGGQLLTRQYRDYTSNFGLAAVGVLGLEYIIPAAPLSVFLEVNPTVSIVPGFFPFMQSGGGIRFMF
jgi:hypothetical protein